MTAGKRQLRRTGTFAPNPKLAEEFLALSRQILSYGNRGVARIEFLREVSKTLLDFSQCDAVELTLRDPDLHYRWEAVRRPKFSFVFQVLPGAGAARKEDRTPGRTVARRPERVERLPLRGPYRSLAPIRFVVNEKTVGLLLLKSSQRNFFTKDTIELYKGLAQSLGLAVASRRAQWALRERVKELTCLYGIARLAQQPGLSLEQSLQGIVELLPPAWQYPEIACARIALDGRMFSTPGFREGSLGAARQSAEIVVGGTRRGAVEVVYVEDRPEFVEGAFLKEEQSLIDTVAREVALIIERREAEDYKSRLQDQLRHADRLATIGQLAAGVAHELNEPLGNILGFAQLIKKDIRLPRQVAEDVEKIVVASLHAREVMHKLLLFSRQMPPKKTSVNLNQVVEEGLYFLESRCAKAGIELVRSLAPDLPEISADPSQLNQVLVNLVVNAVQSMPDGGKLTIQTLAQPEQVTLVVEDTGSGMTKETMKRIFLPFFTTKEIDQGTGLGLAVVHGIVTSHGGSIQVESQVARGSRFEIQLPVRLPSPEEKSGGNG